MMTREIGLGHFTFLDSSPISLVRMARQVGFSWVGLRFNPVAHGQQHWLPDATGLIELNKVMNGEGIALYDVETVIIDEELKIESLLPAFDAAARLGGQRINVCADQFPALGEQFKSLCDAASGFGLSVDIECMAWRGINTPAACIDLIAKSGVDNAAFLVDALHLYRCGGTNELLTEMDEQHIASVQLCDAPAIAPVEQTALIAEARGERLLPGEGGLPLIDLLKAVPDTVKHSVEIPNISDSRPKLERAAAIFRAVQSLINTEAE